MTTKFLDCDIKLSSERTGLFYNAVFFKLPSGYKHDDAYTLGILKLSKYLKAMDPRIVLRVWCDDHRYK